MGMMNYSTAVWEENLESSVTIIGQNGSVRLGGQYMNELQVCNIKGCPVPEFDQPEEVSRDPAYNHHLYFTNVVAVLDGTMHEGSNAAGGSKVVEMVENIYDAG